MKTDWFQQHGKELAGWSNVVLLSSRRSGRRTKDAKLAGMTSETTGLNARFAAAPFVMTAASGQDSMSPAAPTAPGQSEKLKGKTDDVHGVSGEP